MYTCINMSIVHVHDTRSRSKEEENGNRGKWDLAFDSRRRSGPPSTWFDTGPPLHLPPAMPPPIFHILPLVYVSMIAYPPISLYDMGGVGRPYLNISHYGLCTIPDCFTGLQLLYSYSTECRAVACMCVPCFSNYFLASPFRSDRGVSPPSAQNSRSPTFSRRNSRRQPRPAAAAVLSAGQLSEA